MSPKRDLPPIDFCKRAVAYIKGLLNDDEPADPSNPPPLELSFNDSPAFRPLCDGLGIMYLVDAGDHFEYVQYRDLTASGLTIDQLHESAVHNLAAICKERLEIRIHSNIGAFLMGGNFEASCMLVDDLFDGVLAPRMQSGYIAAVPARDVFAVCSRDSTEGMGELRELVERAWRGGDHLISKELFVREDRKWRPIFPTDIGLCVPRS